MVARHGPALLRVANQFSLCQDDALDAYQRGLEIYLRRLETVDPATEGAWMRVVVKHEAMAIRRARQDFVAREDVDLDASFAPLRDVAEQVAGGERVERSVEALRALKPDEAKALMLKAQGLSYQEIGRRFGWTYTKVNRSITEGRARFLKAFRGIEDGEACQDHTDALAALAGGTATSAQVVALRPHLRHCAACRAAVRELRFSRTRRIALLIPGVPVLRRLAGLFSRTDVSRAVRRGLGRRRAPWPGRRARRALPRRGGRGGVREHRGAARGRAADRARDGRAPRGGGAPGRAARAEAPPHARAEDRGGGGDATAGGDQRAGGRRGEGRPPRGGDDAPCPGEGREPQRVRLREPGSGGDPGSGAAGDGDRGRRRRNDRRRDEDRRGARPPGGGDEAGIRVRLRGG